MENFSLKADSIFLFEAFQCIIAENVKSNLFFTGNLAHTIAEILSNRRSGNDATTLDLKPNNSILHEIHLTY